MLLLILRHPTTGYLMHFQRADHFRFVAGVQSGRNDRIDSHEPRIEAIMPMVLYLLPQGSPHDRIGWRCVAQALEQSPHIQPCATNDQWKAGVSIEALDLIERLTPVQPYIK